MSWSSGLSCATSRPQSPTVSIQGLCHQGYIKYQSIQFIDASFLRIDKGWALSQRHHAKTNISGLWVHIWLDCSSLHPLEGESTIFTCATRVPSEIFIFYFFSSLTRLISPFSYSRLVSLAASTQALITLASPRSPEQPKPSLSDPWAVLTAHSRL
jgi:hypothetical protein